MNERNGRRGATRVQLLLAVVVALGLGLLAGRELARRADGASGSSEALGTGAAGTAKQLWTCGMHPQVIQDQPGLCPICHMDLTPLASEVGSDGHGIRIDPVVVQNMGVRVEKVAREPLARTIRAEGWLEEPEPNHHDVNLRVSGWVETLHADVDGMRVARGDPLFELYSPELSVAIEELIAATRAARGDGASASRTAELVRAAAARKLEALGIAREDVEAFAELERAPPAVVFRSPIDGHVTEKNVYAGAAVEAGTRVLRLADRSTMWLEAQVFERDLALVREGLSVHATVDALPGRRLEGRVVFIHPHLDPMTRTALVRAELANPEHVLRQGMYAAVEIASGSDEPVLTVAREAILDTGLRRVAFVSLGAGRFEPRELVTGLTGDGARVQVLEGLAEGEDVVVSGQFLLDAESRIREAVRKHQAGGLVEPADDPAPPAAATPRAERAAESEAPQEALDRVFRTYLALETTLGAVDVDDAPVDASPLATAAEALVLVASGPTLALARDVMSAASRLASGSREVQRAELKPVSDALITLADRAPPSRAVAETLYVLHCPMAPGTWLQSDDDVRNPYYARSMKACGEVVRTIAAREDSP